MRILLLEDEWLLARDMEHALRQAQHDVVGCFATVPEALSAADDSHPDLVLTNIVLGSGGSGIDAARKLAEMGIPSVFVSGSQEQANESRDAAIGILVKPCRAEQIGSSVVAIQAVLAGTEPRHVPDDFPRRRCRVQTQP
jgi:DNA-binding response OmpR family regulator